MSDGKRYLIVNADDLGLNPGINRGIIRAHEQGIVTSASLMVRWPAAVEAASYAREHPTLSVGLHFDFCEWAYRDAWYPVYEVVPLDDSAAVAEEARRQLDEFRRLVGADPTHLDSHQHVHRSEPVCGVLVELARELGVPLRQHTPGIGFCGEFYGQTSQGSPYPEGINAEALNGIIRSLPAGVTELCCHPGEGDDFEAMYRAERSEEVRVLCHPGVRETLVAEAVTLRSFRELDHARPDAAFRERSFRERGIDAYERGNYPDAQSWFQLATRAHSRPWAWLWLSRTEAKLQNREESLASVRKALELQPDWPSAMLHLVDLLARDGQREACLELLERLLELNAEDPQVLAYVVRHLMHLKEYPACRRAAEALLRHDPMNPDGLLAKAVVMWKEGDPSGARALIHSGSEPLTPRAASAAAQLALETGDPLSAWSTLQSLDEPRVGQSLLVRTAYALKKGGNLGAACQAFERAVARDPEDRTTRRARDVTRGEARVLEGAWTAPAVRTGAFQPVPGRVLHLVGKSVPHYQSGYTVRTHYVVQSQRQAGLDPQVITQLNFPWEHEVSEASVCDRVDGVLYHRLAPANGSPYCLDDRLSQSIAGLASLVRRFRPAVLHAASDYLNALLALELGRAFRLPVVYEVRGFWEETWLSKQAGATTTSDGYQWRRERELACMLQADRVVTLAEVMKDHLVRRGVAADKIVVVPNAVDTTAFVPTSPDLDLARSLGIEPGEVVLGYISSFTPYEGIRYLIEATAALIADGHPVRALLVGDGENFHELTALAKALEIGDRVIFTGRVPHADVLRHYSLIDVFIVPRTADSVSQLVTPLKPYEAMAAGRAVVVSRVPALEEMVIEGVTGVTFQPEDSTDLAHVVEPLIGDAERRRALGSSAREWVARERTWAQNGQRYLELYRFLGTA